MRPGTILEIIGQGVKGKTLEEAQGWLAAERAPLKIGAGPPLKMGEILLRGKGAENWRLRWENVSPQPGSEPSVTGWEAWVMGSLV